MKLLILLLFVSVVHGGLYGLFCPPDGNTQAETCQDNCQERHNALYGFCGTQPGDYNCYCTPPKPTRNKKSIQCANYKDHRYDDLCRIDCQCAHNALTGCCNYQTKTCQCQGQNPNPQSKRFCPYKKLEDFKEFVNSLNIPGISIE